MTLEEYRKEIDHLDQQLVQLLVKRIECSQKIGVYKKEHNLIIFDPIREEAIIKEKIRLFTEKGIDDPVFVGKLFLLLFEKSREIQQETNPEIEK